jgi:O-antigen ligase
MKFTTENLIKIALAILLLGCLFHLPYGYYQLLRYVAVVGFAILAYYEYERRRIPMVILYVALAVLFQPLVKIGFGRTVWIVIDIVVAAGLILTLFLRDKRS